MRRADAQGAFHGRTVTNAAGTKDAHLAKWECVVLARPEALIMNLAISRILVPVDFSPHSEFAFHYATALASRLGASVDLLHIMEEDLQENLIEEGERRLERYRSIVEGPGVPMVTTVRTGQPAQTITEYARSIGTDLIVMGTHGRYGFTHPFMGSVAERVVRHPPCPVLTLSDSATRDKTTRMMEHAALGFALGHLGMSRE